MTSEGGADPRPAIFAEAAKREAESLAERTHELSSFIVDVLLAIVSSTVSVFGSTSA